MQYLFEQDALLDISLTGQGPPDDVRGPDDVRDLMTSGALMTSGT